MLFGRTTYKEALEQAPHLVATGETHIYLEKGDVTFAWHNVSDVEAGGAVCLNIPTEVYLIAHQAGLFLYYPVDFAGPDANGGRVPLIDREYLWEVMLKLPIEARRKFAGLLEARVLPIMAQRTKETRDAFKSQWDSEDRVRGLISFGQQDA